MIATDPLSLVFLGCVIFSGGFLLVSTLLGLGHSDGLSQIGHSGHVFHLGGDVAHGDALHLGHADMGHADMGHVGMGHVGMGHAADMHAGHGDVTAHGDTGTQAAPSPWSSLGALLLGALNIYGLLMFLLVFGLVGYLLHTALALGIAAILLAIVAAGASAVGLTSLLTRLFRPPEVALLTSASSRLEGRMGTVTQAIRPGGVGEVIFTRPGGGRQSVGARAADGEAIPRDAEVVILSYQRGIATVQPWERFLAGVKAGKTPELGPME